MNAVGPTLLLMLLLAVPVAGQGTAASAALEIILEHDSEAEREAAHQIRRIVDRYDLGRWTWTRRIRIAEGEIPHSHPVLTLNTSYRGNDAGQLATFLHEQFHWWADARSGAVDAAVADLRALFPEVPVGGGRGARNEGSTYLHLIVCDLELQAVAQLLGETSARALLEANRHYTWIYETVLNDPRVREVTLRHGFDVRLADAASP